MKIATYNVNGIAGRLPVLLRWLKEDEPDVEYWLNSFERGAGLRIDHFLLSPAVAPRLTSASVRRTPRSWEHTSDHAPVMIELAGPE